MSVKGSLLVAVIGVLCAVPAHSYKIQYAEQYYRLYHQNFYSYPEDINENIWYLEHAMESPFNNPLNALSRRITNKMEWERYRYLFYMHVSLELVRQYRLLAAQYDKRIAFFYNAPFREQNLKSLDYAESYYSAALYYWQLSLEWSARAWKLRFAEIDDLQSWMDDNYRVETYELDYMDIIQMDINRLARVREDFLAMDESTY